MLQAELAACHARASTVEETGWRRVARLYGGLAETIPSPVIELNRAVAYSMTFGPEQGLAVLDDVDAMSMRRYHLWPSVRGDLLARLGRVEEASAEFLRAAALTENHRERQLLTARDAELTKNLG